MKSWLSLKIPRLRPFNKSCWVYFPLVLFITLYKAVLVLVSVDKSPSQWKLLSNTFFWFVCLVLFIMLYRVDLTFESVDEILKCAHFNECYWAVLSCGDVYDSVCIQTSTNVLAIEQFTVLPCSNVDLLLSDYIKCESCVYMSFSGKSSNLSMPLSLSCF